MKGDGGKPQILVEQLDGSWSLWTYNSFEAVAQAWADLELDTEGEPGPNDMVIEELPFDELVAYHWVDCDSPVITGHHNLEEIIPAVYRWLQAHELPTDGHIWVKEGGVFSLLTSE